MPGADRPQNLPILPALLQTAILTLLSASIPLSTTFTSVLLAIGSISPKSVKKIIRNPTLQQFQAADSVHVLAFTSSGQLLVGESEGSFTLKEWDEVYDMAQGICCADVETTDDDNMQGTGLEEKGGMMDFVQSTMKEKVSADLHWKG